MNNKNKYVEVNLKDSKDVYKFKYMNVMQTRDLVVKASSLLMPALGASYDLYQELQNNKEEALKFEEEGLEAPVETVSGFPLAAVIGTQMDNPAVKDIIDTLMEDALKNDEPYLPEEEYGEDAFTIYTNIVAASVKVNIIGPLVSCLNAAGYSEIVGFVQTVINQKKI